MADLAECDLVIEAVFEDMAVKKELFATLDGILKPGAILATNTSYLDIDEMAAVTSRAAGCRGPAFLQPGRSHEAAGNRAHAGQLWPDALDRAGRGQDARKTTGGGAGG